jgi:signal transduction histidine kinase
VGGDERLRVVELANGSTTTLPGRFTRQVACGWLAAPDAILARTTTTLLALTGIDANTGAAAKYLEITPPAVDLKAVDSLVIASDGSLLGIRLPRHHELLGVMYVGIRDARAFLPREVSRFIALGTRLALHLENAWLVAALREKVSALDAERLLREQFVSALAHDLRGPLSSARLVADLLGSEPKDSDTERELARRLSHNVERMEHMIRDLLDANRIRAGERLPLQVGPVDLVVLANEVADEARALHGDRFVVAAGEPVLGIWSGDELRRALWNLVTNAVKYGAPRLPITIIVERVDQLARISVHNVGEPIPAAEQTHIFDRYTRARSAQVSDRSGWGLGLTLVKGTAVAHGGHVSVESDRESGTTFTIEIPLDATQPRRDEAAGAVASSHFSE